MPPQQKNKKPQNQVSPQKTIESLTEAYRKMGPYLNIGYFFVASVSLMTFLGWYLDKKWDTRPWLTVVGAILGIAAGFYNFFKVVSRPPDDQIKKSNENR